MEDFIEMTSANRKSSFERQLMVQDILSVVVFRTFLRRAVQVLRLFSGWNWGQVIEQLGQRV